MTLRGRFESRHYKIPRQPTTSRRALHLADHPDRGGTDHRGPRSCLVRRLVPDDPVDAT